ncbi:MAG: molybdopterin molybdotransferase MoeA [Actinomycetota bacterium]
MLSVAEAQERVLAAITPLETADVLIGDALGMVLADELVAPQPLPRFDNSAMDGFAVRSEETSHASAEAPVELEVVGEVRAGDPGELKVLPGTAVRIMTGAPVPVGADAVVAVEDTDENDGTVVVKASTPAGRHVRPAGDDLSSGDVLVEAGAELGPGEMALLASMGFSPVAVRQRPKVAVLVTGDELIPPEAEPGPGQIRDSNTIALRALVAEAGAEVVPCEVVTDEYQVVVAAFARAAELCDLVVSSGGVAVGKYDFVKAAVEELGRIELWRVAMQPGKPVVLGSIGSTPFLGLPGNPVSIHIGFEQFVRPAIRKLRGCKFLLRPVLLARVAETITKKPGRLHFVRVRLTSDDGWVATPTGSQGSHIQSSLVDCHGVARFPAEATILEAGTEVVVEVWNLPAADRP